MNGGRADSIFIERLRCRAHVGVPPAERRRSQRVLIDLELRLDLRRAGREDRVEATADYAAVCREVTGLLRARQFKLVEAMAEAIAREILARHPLRGVRVRVRKFSVPQAAGVGVEIRRDRSRGNRWRTT